MGLRIRLTTPLLLSVVLSCTNTFLRQNVINAQNVSTTAQTVTNASIADITNASIADITNASIADISNASIADVTNTTYSKNATQTRENGTERSDILVFDTNGTIPITEISFYNETASNREILLFNDSITNETVLVLGNTSSFLNSSATAYNLSTTHDDIFNHTSSGTENSSLNLTVNSTGLDVPFMNSTVMVTDLANETTTSNFYISTNQSQLVEESLANLTSNVSTSNTTEGNSAQNLTTPSYEPIDKGKVTTDGKNGTELSNVTNAGMENKTTELEATSEAVNVSTTQDTERPEIIIMTTKSDNRSFTPYQSEVYTLSDEVENSTVNSTEVTPFRAVFFIPYASGNYSKTQRTTSTSKMLTNTFYNTATTTKTPNVTVGTGSGFVKDVDLEEPSTKDEEQRSKPEKKVYEDLTPEEKENIVTVVFNHLIGNWTADLEKSFSNFVSKVMSDYLKIWSTVKEPGNELSTGLERAEVTIKNIHYLKPTPYFSKDLMVAMVTFYVTSSSPSAKSTVLPAEIVVENLKEVQVQLQKKLHLNATDMFIGAHPRFAATKAVNGSQFITRHEPLFVALIAVTGTCLFTLVVAIICFKCQNKGHRRNNNDREKLHKEQPHFMRGLDLSPEHEILRDERLQSTEKDCVGVVNGEKKYLVQRNGDDGWMVPMGDMPYEDQNAPAIQDTRL